MFQIHFTKIHVLVYTCNRELLDVVKVRHCISSPYHPQTNGLDERFNQTLSRMLVKLTTTNKEDWDLYIESALYAYRVSPHHSTKYTPFFFYVQPQSQVIGSAYWWWW